MDGWYASYELDPDELAQIKEILKLGFAALATAAFQTEIKPSQFEPKRKRLEKPQTTKEQIATIKAVRGRIGRWRQSATS